MMRSNASPPEIPLNLTSRCVAKMLRPSLNKFANVMSCQLDPGTPLPADADLIILPGSKTTRQDLEALYAEGWDIDLKAHVRRGGLVVGL